MSAKVVYNACYGGFSLSDKAKARLTELGMKLPDYDWQIPRHDKLLVQVVEELGKEANGDYADLCVETIDGNKYRIEEYDGKETIVESNDIEWIVVG